MPEKRSSSRSKRTRKAPRDKTSSSRSSTRRRSGGRGRRSSKATRRRSTRWGGYVLAGTLLVAAAGVWFALVVVSAGRAAVVSLRASPPGAPVEVLAAPRVLRLGDEGGPAAVVAELASSGYVEVRRAPRSPGEYRFDGETLAVYRRAFPAAHGVVESDFVRARWRDGRLLSLTDERSVPRTVFTCEPLSLGSFRGALHQDREHRSVRDFPPRMVEAVLAAEDARFLDHRGLDARGIVRAAWIDLRRGSLKQGGSTITQQVIKNRIVGGERTLLRKLREAFLSLYVERRLDKDELLTIYLNEVYLGQRGAVSIVGIPAAARHYFGRDLADLRLDEMTLLAGMIASPGRFDPRRHPESALARRAWVLSRMEQLGYIDESEREGAGGRPLVLAPEGQALDPAGDILDAVYRELTVRGWEPEPGARVVRVQTSIDPRLQRAARRALSETIGRLERERPSRRPLEGAVVVLRHTTGEIAALVGGRAGIRGHFNRALDARRQPGSAFKPFVALAAFADGDYAPASALEDAPLSVDVGAGAWRPRNHDGVFRGEVSVRRALEESINVPIVRLGLDVGPETVRRTAETVGFGSGLPRTPSIALGTGEASPLDLAQAYATLAALGTRREPSIVRAIVAPDGQRAPRVSGTVPAEERIAPAPAWLVLDALTGVVERGTGRALARAANGSRVAAKTGTSQDGRDAWFVLVTGSSVVVTWIGRDDAKPAGLFGSRAALPVVERLLREAGHLLLDPLPDPPDGVRRLRYDAEEACVLGSSSRKGRWEYFLEGHEPPPCRRSWWRRLVGGSDR